MGGEDETIPQVMAGSLDMSLSGPSVWGTNAGITALDWSEYPYVVTNYSEMNALGEILPDITNKQLEALGLPMILSIRLTDTSSSETRRKAWTSTQYLPRTYTR